MKRAKLWGSILLLAVTLCVLYAAYYTKSGSCELPVLMYHHFTEASTSDTIVSEERFREQMTALHEAGFETVTLKQLYNYVHFKRPLPEKPLLITMDDGYTSNLDMAGPILEELGMCATVFVIGINEGEEYYVHTGEPFYQERFSYEEAIPWVEKGVIDVQCHTYDMHQLASYGISGRDGMYPLEGESWEDYQEALAEDFAQFRQRRENVVETELLGLAYPFGYYTEELDQSLQDEVAITFTIEERMNTIGMWDTQTLRMLGRYNVTDRMTGQALVEKLERAMEG